MYYRRALEIQCIQDKADLGKFNTFKITLIFVGLILYFFSPEKFDEIPLSLHPDTYVIEYITPYDIPELIISLLRFL